MSVYQKASLVQIPSGYKASAAKLYSVVPSSGDGDFTISADADATRVNKDGLIESVAANQARLNYDFDNPQDPHLLLEPTRTNYAEYSENFSLWATSTSNGTVTRTANYATAPDGSNTATRLQASVTGGSGYALVTESTTSFFGDYSSTVYMKSTNGSNQEVCIYGRNTGNQVVTVTNQWQRFEINGSSTSGQSNFVNIGVNLGFVGEDNPIDVLIWGGQIEAGSYASSYIPNTSTGFTTRTEDFCHIPSGLQNILNTSEGTLFVDVEVPRVSSTGSFERIVLSDQNSSTDRIIFDNYAGNWRALMISSAGTVSQTIVSVTANQRIKVAIAYSSTQLRVSYDGNAATTTTGSYTPSTTLESFKFSNKDGGSKWQGKIYQAMYFNTALTNTELQTLTS